MTAPTILLVDDDETLSRVLRRVLTQQGYTVTEAGSVAQALQAARENPPQLGLLDLRLPDGDGVELARKLAEGGARFPVILMTAYPLRLRDQPDLARQFVSVMTKPLNLQELRHAIEAALNGVPSTPPPPAVAARPAPPSPTPSQPEAAGPRAAEKSAPAPVPTPPAIRRRAVLVAVCILALAGLAALPALGVVRLPFGHKGDGGAATGGGADAGLAARPVPGDADGLELPPDVVQRLGLTTAEVEAASGTRPLRLSGTINYDPDYLQRVHALFGGEVIEIAEVVDNVRGVSERRKLSFGDRVRKGELLAVVWSKDLGQMKSALVDALVKLRFDEQTLARYDPLVRSGGLSEATYRGQQTVVSLDRSAVAAAENALVVARVPDAEIQAVKDEAEKIFERQGVRNAQKVKDWARVEVRARMDGTIVEKNIVVGDTPDTSKDLFVVADLEKLAVWANAYEEDLSELNKLSLPYPWQVRLAADVRAGGQSGPGDVLNSPFLEKLSPAIDPNQHTALLIGRVENPPGEKLKVGRFVAVAIDLPQPGNTVAVPVSALDEDGETSVVFVQPDANRLYYSQRRVAVVQRLADVVLVRTRLTEDEQKRGLQALKAGDHVVTRQTFLLRGALQDLKARAKEGGPATEPATDRASGRRQPPGTGK